MSFAPDGVPVPTGEADDRLLPWTRVQDIAGISRSTAWRLQQRGAFPAPVAVSPGRVAWWESELNAWKALRSKPPGPPKGLKPPRQPRFAGTSRRSRPAPCQAEPSEPVKPAPAVEAPRRRSPRRRSRPVSPDQFDFGF